MANDPNIGRIAVNKRTGERQMWMGKERGFVPVDQNNRTPPPAEVETSLKAIQEARERRDASRAVVDGLATFNEINRRVSTGPIYSNIKVPFIGDVNPGRMVTNLINPGNAADLQTMDSIAERLAPQMRTAGAGASSDKDVEGFKRSIPSVDKFGTANQAISQEYQRLLQLNQRRLDELTDQYNRTRTVVGGPAQSGGAAMPQGGGQRRLSPQEAASLPPGTRFIGTDGVERIRR